MLQQWHEKNVVRPAKLGRPGQASQYDLKEAVLCMIVVRLRSCQVNLQRVKKLVTALSKDPQFIEAVEDHDDLYLLISPKIAKKCETPERVIAVMRDFKVSFILIPVHDFVADLHRQELVN
jgi:hypothetical protein